MLLAVGGFDQSLTSPQGWAMEFTSNSNSGDTGARPRIGLRRVPRSLAVCPPRLHAGGASRGYVRGRLCARRTASARRPRPPPHLMSLRQLADRKALHSCVTPEIGEQVHPRTRPSGPSAQKHSVGDHDQTVSRPRSPAMHNPPLANWQGSCPGHTDTKRTILPKEAVAAPGPLPSGPKQASSLFRAKH